jgi:hypothetical protein
MIRVVRNRGRIGKAWQVVEGDYQPWNRTKEHFATRWKTALVLSEHATRIDAEATRREYAKERT